MGVGMGGRVLMRNDYEADNRPLVYPGKVLSDDHSIGGGCIWAAG